MGDTTRDTGEDIEVRNSDSVARRGVDSLVLVRVQNAATRRSRRAGARRHKIDAATTLRALPEIATALQARKLVEIVGPSDVLKGIKDGSLSFTQGANGFTSVVRASDGKIVGHVQLQWAHGAMGAAAASAAWQVAAAITLQHYLHRIDKELSRLEADLRALRTDAAWAVLERGAHAVQLLVAHLQQHGRLDDRMRQRLDDEERAVDVIVRQEMRRVVEVATSARMLSEELRQLMLRREQRGKMKNAASAVVGSLPGGVRTQLLEGVSDIRRSMPSWELVCRGRDIHAALVLLDRVDAALSGHADLRVDRLRRDSLSAAAQELRRHIDGVGELCSIDPTELGQLYHLDGRVNGALQELTQEHLALSVAVDESLAMMVGVANTRVTALTIEQRRRELYVA